MPGVEKRVQSARVSLALESDCGGYPMRGFRLPDFPNGDWPLIFLAVDGALLAFLALWWLAKVTLSTPDADQADDTKDEQRACGEDDL